MSPAPPRAAVRLLRAVIDERAQESYVGDLLELFDERAARDGVGPARRAFWRDTAVALARLPWRRAARSHPHPGDPVLVALATELRLAARRLRRAPAFALLSALTLALGIGATTAVFSVAYSALIRPLPYPDAERLVAPVETSAGLPSTVSPTNFHDWAREVRTMELAAWDTPSLALTGDGPAEQVPAAEVTGAFFRVLGVTPALGRAVTDADAVPNGARRVVLSHALWTRRFGADPRVLGRTVRLGGESYEVLGVMPRGFAYPARTDLWVPLAFSADELAKQRGAHYLSVVGRLRPGATRDAAQAELGAIAARLAAAYPTTNTGHGALVRTLREATVGDARTPLVALLCAVGLLLALACANVANLLLVRAARHERDRVVRAALGAGRAQLVRAVLGEAVLLAALGAVVGTALAWWGTRALDATIRAVRPALAESRMDAPVLAFALGTAVVTALGFGLLPALGASRLRELAGVLRGATTAGRGRAAVRWRWGWRLRGSLVAAQIAITTLLLAGAVLLGESFLRLRRVELGFEPRDVWTFSLGLPDAAYTPARARAFYGELLTRVRATPGVTSAGAMMGLPLDGDSYIISLVDRDGVRYPEPSAPSTQVRVVTEDVFRTLGMRVLRGRALLPTDREDAPPAVVVNEAMARLVWPEGDALGRRFTLGTRLGLGGERVGGTVVGVVADVRALAVQEPPRPEVYVAHRQFPIRPLTIAVRGPDAASGALARSLAAHVAALDPNVPVYQERSLDALVADAVAEPRLYTLLFAAFAGTALLLAAVGVFGVVSLAVGQRTREFGVRVALGARGGDVVTLVLRQALAPVVVGLAVGLGAALAGARLLRALLYEVGANDPLAFALTTLALGAVATVAVLVPTRRATRVEPTVTLRDG